MNGKKYAVALTMVDFHVRVLSKSFYPGWLEAYTFLLDKITEQDDFYCDTPLNIARWYENNNPNRRQVIRKEIIQ